MGQGMEQVLRDAGLLGDDSAFMLHYELPRIKAIAKCLPRPLRPIVRVLDVGFLDGHVPFILQRLWQEQTRLELTCAERPDPDALARARAQSISLFGEGAVEVLGLDLVDLADGTIPASWAADRESFDAIVLGEVVEHIPNIYAPGILRGLRELLAPGGLLILTTPNLHSATNRLRHMLGVDFTHDPISSALMGYPHLQLFSMRQLQDLAHVAGYVSRSVDTYNFTSAARRDWSATRALRKLVTYPASLRDDLVMSYAKDERRVPPSAVYGRSDTGIRAGIAAARAAMTPD